MEGSVRFILVLEAVQGLPKSSALFYLQWSVARGLKKNSSGETKKVLQSGDGSVIFNADVNLDVNVNSKSGSVIKISIKEEDAKKKAKTACKLELDLSEFASIREFETKLFNLVGSKVKPPPSLRFRVKASGGSSGAAPSKPAEAPVAAAGKATAGAAPLAPIGGGTSSDDDDTDESKKGDASNPFGEAPKKETGYAGNALFKKIGGDYEEPQKVDSAQVLLEQAKNATGVPREETYTGNALFKTRNDEFKTPGKYAPSSTVQLMEDAKLAAAAKKDTNPFASSSAAAAPVPNPAPASNPFAAPPSTPVAVSVAPSAAVVSPPVVGSPYGALSPSSEELTLLRKQNKMLQETLDKQEEKIDQLRQKMRSNRAGAAKAGSPPSPSFGGESFLREKERAIEDLTTKLAESEKALASQTALVAKANKGLDAEKDRNLRLTQNAEELAELLADQKKRADGLGIQLKTASEQLEAEKRRSASVETDLKKDLQAVQAQLEGEKRRAVALEASAKGNGDAVLSENKNLVNKLAEAQKQGETWKLALAAKEKELEAEKRRTAALDSQVLEMQKREAIKLESAQKAERAESTASSAKLAEYEKQTSELNAKLQAVGRELSGQQLLVVELSNRLRDAEAACANQKASSQDDGEVSSLQMQIVAMEQDYESQLDELRNELEELRGGGRVLRGSGRSNGSGNDTSSRRNTLTSQKSVQNMTLAAGPDEQLKEKNKAIESLQEQVASLERQLAAVQVPPSPLHGFKNPLMESGPPASPFAQDEFEKLVSSLNVMQAVQDCVWSAKMTFEDNGVAVACGLIMRCLKEDHDVATAPDLYEKLAVAIETAATSQLSLDGRMYWLNVVTNLLEEMSKTVPGSSVRSPKEVGIVIVGPNDQSSGAIPQLRRQESSARNLLALFPARLARVCFSVYRITVEDMRRRILPNLATAVFKPAINAKASLGARHNISSAVTTEVIVYQLDAALAAATASHLFPVVVKQMFSQIFYDMGASLFNAMMKREDLTASRAIAVKLEVSSFDNWPSTETTTAQTKDLLRQVSARGLNPIKEVCNLLFIDKATFLERSAVAEMCPSLNARQVKSFLSAFVPDEICPERTPLEVLDRLTAAVKKTDPLKIDETHWLPPN